MTVGCRNPCDDIERLKVCGTCGHLSFEYGFPECSVGHYGVGVTDECHCGPYCEHTWTPYWELEAK